MLNMKINIVPKKVLMTFVQYSSASLESISLSLYIDMKDPAEVVVDHCSALVHLIGNEEDKVAKGGDVLHGEGGRQREGAGGHRGRPHQLPL